MPSINRDMLRQLLDHFVEQEEVINEEIQSVEEQIVDMESKMEDCRERLESLEQDRYLIVDMQERYANLNLSGESELQEPMSARQAAAPPKTPASGPRYPSSGPATKWLAQGMPDVATDAARTAGLSPSATSKPSLEVVKGQSSPAPDFHEEKKAQQARRSGSHPIKSPPDKETQWQRKISPVMGQNKTVQPARSAKAATHKTTADEKEKKAKLPQDNAQEQADDQLQTINDALRHLFH